MAATTGVLGAAGVGAGLRPANSAETGRVGASDDEGSVFQANWANSLDRIWIGSEYWANPLQDWKVSSGRVELVRPLMDRNVHALTCDVTVDNRSFTCRVRVGRAEGKLFRQDAKGTAGFRVGIRGPLAEYRNNLLYGRGLDVGVTGDGQLFIGDPIRGASAERLPESAEVELRLVVEPMDGEVDTPGGEGVRNRNNIGRAAGKCRMTLTAHASESGKELGRMKQDGVTADTLSGNVAIAANVGPAPRAGARGGRANASSLGADRFWFADWRVAGPRVALHPERAFGPILFSQYTVSGGILKLTAQMPPLGSEDETVVQLQIRDAAAHGSNIERREDKESASETGSGDSLGVLPASGLSESSESEGWRSIADAVIDPQSRTASFRVKDWDASHDQAYRLVYVLRMRDGSQEECYWGGTMRRDPVDQPVLTVADISCNIHWVFPNSQYVEHMRRVDPDLLAFVGDQFYESTGGYGIVRDPLDVAIVDYLRKWFIHGWTWRDLLRDRPSVALPDDHDVYQGNVWGEGGAGRQATQEAGGYSMHAEWVNVVHRTQTSHHPDPFDDTPIKQDITVYYGPLTYGRVSFAVLADRMFKTGPDGVAPPTGGRADHVTDPHFDPKTADVPEAELLGARQMDFLREWAADWRGAEMKAVISQTIFTAMATHHGGEHMRLIADYDTNGWPQSARNEALRVIRKAFAVHLAGDQHLPAVVHYGIDRPRDAGIAFAGPAVNVGYPRSFEPDQPGENRAEGASELTGDFRDSFGHPMTVLAVKNPEKRQRTTPLELMDDKASGMGIVRFDKPARRITIECWPYLVDPTAADAKQFPGWPVVVDMMQNFGDQPVGHLPEIEVVGMESPVVQLIHEPDRELVYALRLAGRVFRPPVFNAGPFTVRIGEPDRGEWRELSGVSPVASESERIVVRF